MQRFEKKANVAAGGGGIGSGVCPGPTDTALFADYKQGAGIPGLTMNG